MSKEYEFLMEFGELLKKYDVGIEQLVEYSGYGCEDVLFEFCFNNSPYTIVNVGRSYIDYEDMFKLAEKYKEN